jgi:hypothetical protein
MPADLRPDPRPRSARPGRPAERDRALDLSTRALASYRMAIEDPIYEARYHNFCEGEGCWQEALQHADRTGDPHLLLRINDEVEVLREQALLAIQAGA